MTFTPVSTISSKVTKTKQNEKATEKTEPQQEDDLESECSGNEPPGWGWPHERE